MVIAIACALGGLCDAQVIATGDRMTSVIKADGSLWSWGDAQMNGDWYKHAAPYHIAARPSWRAVASAQTHTIALDSDGSLWAWGCSLWGAHGLSTDTVCRATPLQTLAPLGFVRIATSSLHSAAVDESGALWTWGNNELGQLGVGDVDAHPGFNRVGTATDWQAVAVGPWHTVAIKADGTLWGWGSNEFGMLTQAGGPATTEPVQAAIPGKWTAVAAGDIHTVALQDDGSMWAWGGNSFGQTGKPASSFEAVPSKIESGHLWRYVASAGSHNLAIRDDGTLWAWGKNDSGQLGDGTRQGSYQPVQVGTDEDWQSVAATAAGSAGVRGDGTVWAWGSADYQRLGDLESQRFDEPRLVLCANVTCPTFETISVGRDHALAIDRDRQLWAWGSNEWGQLGDGTATYQAEATRVGHATAWAAIASGYTHSLGVTDTGAMYQWGEYSYGSRREPPSPVRPGMHAVDNLGTAWLVAAAGQNFSAAIKSDGSLWTWGWNYQGVLGDGTTSNRTAPGHIAPAFRWIQVSCGASHMLAIRADGTLWAWGDNQHGQLGLGTTTPSWMPTQISDRTDWLYVSAGADRSFAVDRSGALWVWGMVADVGISGVDNSDRAIPVRVDASNLWVTADAGHHGAVLGVRGDATLRSWGGALAMTGLDNGDYFGRKWRAAGVGASFAILLDQHGVLWSVGRNGEGQLASGYSTEQPQLVTLTRKSSNAALSLTGGLPFLPARLGETNGFAVTLKAEGPNTVVLRGISNAGAPFWLSHNCPETLEVAQSCTLTVTFRPKRRGVIRDKILIDTDSTISGAPFNLLGLGLGHQQPLDIDGDGTVTTMQDGVLMTRYLLGLRGNALVQGAVSATGIRTTSEEVAGYLQILQENLDLDIDGDGVVQAKTDGVLLLRALLGFADGAVTNSALGSSAQRNQWLNGVVGTNIGTYLREELKLLVAPGR